jgi:anaerobic magnesium-protoporphyrin IX monomethyl ester cyclase
MSKKILLAAEDSALDPLASFYLSAVARQEGWDPKIVLSKGPKYNELQRAMDEFNPDVLGATLYTGNHEDMGLFFREAKRRSGGDLTTVVGGPHPTYFPKGCLDYADFVVAGPGFDALRRILRGTAERGIVYLEKEEGFPLSDRDDFYRDNPRHGENPIKNSITGTGCNFRCKHCYNSNNVDDVDGITGEQAEEIKATLGSKRFWPTRQRPVDDVVAEIEYLQRISPSTKMLFLEDDIIGCNIGWLEEFTEKYHARLPFHANMRFELVNPNTAIGRKRVELLREAGCGGLSMAIETESETMRLEVLNRNTPEQLIFDAMGHLGEAGFKVRTYQMLGLPYGATTKETKINLDADLDTLKLNVELREKTGLPTVTWAATLVPYPGTGIEKYCLKHGFREGGTNNIVGPSTFWTESVLRHPKNWVGPSLSAEGDFWMNSEEQGQYRAQLKNLMDHFSAFSVIPDGHNVARELLENGEFEFNDVFTAMKERGAFDQIPEGKELEDRLEGAGASGPGIFKAHMYDRVLFRT